MIKHNLYEKTLIGMAIILAIMLSSFSFVIDNSYWWDELYSVVASSLSFKQMFSDYILNDVHPPLHLLLLKVWMYAFGDSEVSTRALSYIFSTASLIIIAIWSSKNLSKYTSIATILFFASSWLVSYYAQETRAYSLMLLFSTILTILFIEVIQNYSNKKLYLLLITLFLLTLTHYFGLIYGGLILLYLLYFLKPLKQKMLIVITGTISLIWPIIHYLYGPIGNKTGGSFWVKSEGVQTTFTTFINSILPHSHILNKISPDNYQFLILAVGVIVLLLLAYIFKKYGSNFINNIELNQLKHIFLLFIMFVILISLIDLHSPISTERNFIVLLPLISIIFGIMISSLKAKIRIYYIVLFLIIGSSFYFNYMKINNKIEPPIQNHKEVAGFIIDNDLLNTHKVYYGHHKNSNFPTLIYKNMASFYLPPGNNIYGSYFENITELIPPFAYISQHHKLDVNNLIDKYADKNISINIYEPEVRNHGALVIYSK